MSQNADMKKQEREQIVELGSHQQLMEKDGEYARLCRAQDLGK